MRLGPIRLQGLPVRERLLPAERPPRVLAKCALRGRYPDHDSAALRSRPPRQDLVNLKAMGFNGIRFISTMGLRYLIDICDEIGLMVYEESHASWMVEDSPKLAERQDSSVSGMILRDRNHPSVVMWGLLNETGDGGVFRHAVAQLPLVRRLDDSRVVLLGSGRFDTMNFMNGLEIWKPDAGFAPCLTRNPKSYAISCVTLWRPNEVALIPGVNGEYGRGAMDRPRRRRLHDLLQVPRNRHLYHYRHPCVCSRQTGVQQLHQLAGTRRRMHVA